MIGQIRGDLNRGRGRAWLIAGLVGVGALWSAAPAYAQQGVCAKAVARTAVDGRQNRNWNDADIATLCTGAEDSAEPATCYTRLMSGKVNYGGGTQWRPANAVRLCAGARSAKLRIDCFTGKVAQQVAWSDAIDQCTAGDRRAVSAAPPTPAQSATPPLAAVPTAVAKSATPSAGAGASDAERTRNAAMSTAAILRCRGPLTLDIKKHTNSPSDIRYFFTLSFQPAASAESIAPGQCWRNGGWGDGALMPADGMGLLRYESIVGACHLFDDMRIADGRVSNIASSDDFGPQLMFRLAFARSTPETVSATFGGMQSGTGGRPAALFNVASPPVAERTTPACRPR